MSAWPRRWRARWIWWEAQDVDGAFVRGEAVERPPDGLGFLRRRFTLDEVGPARCRITCDGRYALWVNGSLLGRGPVRSQPWSLTYDTYDLSPHLQPGENVVGVLARHYGGPTPWWIPAQPVGEVGFGALAFEADVGGAVLGSDERWRVRIAPYERRSHAEGPPPDEVIDGRSWPAGWTEPGFDDADWDPACVLTPSGPGEADPHPPSAPFTDLRPRPIPPLEPTMIEPVASDGLTFDLGRIAHAHPAFELIGAEPGTVVELYAGEALDDDGAPISDLRAWRLRYAANGRDDRAESFEPIGFRYLQATVQEGSVERIELRATEWTAPHPGRASFASSDPALARIWDAGVRTVLTCSPDAFIDGPGREQRAWLSDSYGHALVWLLLDPDAAMPRWMLRLHAHGVRPDGLLPMVAAGDFSLRATTIPDQSLWWVMALDLVHRHTGDDVLADELFGVARGVLDRFESWRGPLDLLADVPGWVFLDWAQVQRDTHIAVLDGLYAKALAAGERLANALGEQRAARIFTERRVRTAAAFERYWDDARGVYVDAVDASGEQRRRVSQHANALAIATGIASPSRHASILEAICDDRRVVMTRTAADAGDLAERVRSPELDPVGFDEQRDVVMAQPFFCHVLHEAFMHAGRTDLLLASIRRWDAIIANGCFGEYWVSPAGRASLCHAWTAVPLYDLATHVLGLRLDGSVEPHVGDLGWAEGVIATRDGFRRVRVDGEGVVAEPA